MKKSRSSNSLESILATKPIIEQDAKNLDFLFEEISLSPGAKKLRGFSFMESMPATGVSDTGDDEVKWRVYTPKFVKRAVGASTILGPGSAGNLFTCPLVENLVEVEIDCNELLNYIPDPKRYSTGPMVIGGRILTLESSWNDS